MWSTQLRVLQDVVVEFRKATDRLYRMSEDAIDELQKTAEVTKDKVIRAWRGCAKTS